MQDISTNELVNDLKNPLLYYYKWFVKYSNGTEVYHFSDIKELIDGTNNKFGELDFSKIITIGLIPLRDGLKPVIVDLSPFKHINKKKPIYWRRRVFCSDNSYPPFHIYIVGYEINVDNKNISFSVCVYPNGTIEITDKEPQNIDEFINNLKNSINKDFNG
jgi:adenine-specific DNA methylase